MVSARFTPHRCWQQDLSVGDAPWSFPQAVPAAAAAVEPWSGSDADRRVPNMMRKSRVR